MESSTRRRRRAVRALIAGVGATLVLTGCGFDMQTLQPYTPAHGVNIDVKTDDNNRQLKVRNLLVISDTKGQGVLSASMTSPVTDRLVSVSGTPFKADNSAGTPLTVTQGAAVELKADQIAVLTNPAPVIKVSSPDLRPGLTVDLTLTFASGRTAHAVAPVMSYDDPIYTTVSPAPASASATPARTATPTPTATP
ncbi:MAG: hypothetical protein QM708_10650 [Propioniciclava sp.]|uniref:hypothetical protein n=1 Tax=Propioniciclava sp. TaxID=2038686 RepID=UPI0039E5CF9E